MGRSVREEQEREAGSAVNRAAPCMHNPGVNDGLHRVAYSDEATFTLVFQYAAHLSYLPTLQADRVHLAHSPTSLSSSGLFPPPPLNDSREFLAPNRVFPPLLAPLHPPPPHPQSAASPFR